MKKDNGYHVLSSPSRFQQKITEELDLACCDCNLVHRMKFRVKGDTLFVRITRLDDETKRLRSARKK